MDAKQKTKEAQQLLLPADEHGGEDATSMRARDAHTKELANQSQSTDMTSKIPAANNLLESISTAMLSHSEPSTADTFGSMIQSSAGTSQLTETNANEQLPAPASEPQAEQTPEPQAEQIPEPQVEVPPAELTPEQKRLRALQSKQATLTSTLSTLNHERSALLISLSRTLPPYITGPLDLDIPSSPPYTPSTLSHTVPCLPEVSPEDSDELLKEAKKVVRQHIELLHTYNEIKDVGQGLIGMIAEQRGIRVVDCQEEFGVGIGD